MGAKPRNVHVLPGCQTAPRMIQLFKRLSAYSVSTEFGKRLTVDVNVTCQLPHSGISIVVK